MCTSVYTCIMCTQDHVYTYVGVHMCVFRRSIEGRGGARWRLVDFVVPSCLRLDSLETDPEMKNWVQVIRGHSQEMSLYRVERQDRAEEEAHLLLVVGSEASDDLIGQGQPQMEWLFGPVPN